MRKTAGMLAAALLLAAILSAGIGAGAKAYAAPDDVIPLDPDFLLNLCDARNHADLNSDGQITQGEMAAVTSLIIDGGAIASISGIEYATGLQSLTIAGTSITAIPSGISGLTALTSLEIKNNTLLGNDGLPAELWGMAGLVNLTLYDIGLTSIPAGLGNLTNLTELNLQSNAIASLPPEIGNLSQLQTFNIWGNRLTSISSVLFDGMANLASLDIVENYLDPRSGSDDCAQIDAIKTAHPSAYIVYAAQKTCPVSLNYNGGTGSALPKPGFYYGESVTLPTASKAGFTFIGWDTDGNGTKDRNAGDTVQITPSPVTASLEFTAIYNYTVTFKTQIYGTINSGSTDIAVTVAPGGKLSTVPVVAANAGYESLDWYDGDTRLTSATILDMTINSNKTFTAKYEAVGTIHSITDVSFKNALYAAGADCIDVDGFITEAEMASLSSLSLITGGFSDLSGIGYATNLTSLVLGTGNVTALPAEIGSLTKLESLIIIDNPIASLPTQITGITSLTSLTLSNCDLVALPANTDGITTLTSLDLSNNHFTAVPSAISGLTSLTELNLSGNLLTTLPDNFFSPLPALSTLNLQANYLYSGAGYVGLPSCADLTAQHTYAITLDFNGGTGAALPKTGYCRGEPIPLPAASKALYQFVGWDADGDGDADTVGQGTVSFAPVPPDSAASKTYTAIFHSSDAALSSVGITAGAYMSPAFDPAVTSYTVMMYDYVGDVTVTPVQSSPLAAMTINGVSSGSVSLSLAPSGETTVTVAVTAEDGVTARSYSILVKRAAAVNLDLAALSGSISMSPAFSAGVTSYAVQLTAAQGGVTLSAVPADPSASVSINGIAGAAATVLVDQGQSVDVPVVVSKPASTDRTKTYTVTLRRGTTLSAFGGAPKMGKFHTLSPGGTNRLTFTYTMNGPGTVKLEVYKSRKWVQIMTREETSAGVKTWDWDGKAAGRVLSATTYKVRITPSAYGMTGASSTIDVKIVRASSVAWKSVIKTFKATGGIRMLCMFKVTQPTNALVRVYNSKGRVVAVVKTVTNMYPNKFTTVTWDGLATEGNNASLAAGTLVPKGTYTIRITVGSKTYSKAFKLTR